MSDKVDDKTAWWTNIGSQIFASHLPNSALPEISIHRSHYRTVLIEALRSNHPMTFLRLGQHNATAVSLQYIAAHPSTHYDLNSYGENFALFINSLSELVADHPDLPLLAQFEYLVHTLNEPFQIDLPQGFLKYWEQYRQKDIVEKPAPKVINWQVWSTVQVEAQKFDL